DIAGHALAEQFAPARLRQRRQMRVGEMGEGEHLFVMAGLVPAIPLMRHSAYLIGITGSRAIQVGYSRLGHVYLPISGRPEIGSGPVMTRITNSRSIYRRGTPARRYIDREFVILV